MILWLFRLGFIASLALAAFLLLAPGRVLNPYMPVSLGDVALHTGVMAVVAALGILGFFIHRYRIALVLIGVGIVTEFGQLLVPGREFHVSDMAANMAGIFLGYVAGFVAARFLGAKFEPRLVNKGVVR